GCAVRPVVFEEPPPQTMGFHPNNRVFPRVVSGRALEELDADEGLLEASLPGALLSQIPKELAKPWAGPEHLAFADTFCDPLEACAHKSDEYTKRPLGRCRPL